MAALLVTSDSSELEESVKEVFRPQEATEYSHSFDVTLVVEDGKEFQAHGYVLSDASPFFEKLFNSDMKEANEGIIRLEMLTESAMADILEFIYTGSVQIAPENAKDLIAMAEFLILPRLKTLAEEAAVRTLMIDASDCISTYHFAEIYQCPELACKVKQFIDANFTTVAKAEEFLKLPSKEVEKWISSDDIDVSAEEDVFEIIITWIDRDKTERKKYFAELFPYVRLAYVTLDYLSSTIAWNELVKDNEDCLDLVKNAMKFLDSKDYNNLTSVKPRKSLETHAIVAGVENHLLCYFPGEDRWSRLGDNSSFSGYLASGHCKLYSICPSLTGRFSICRPQMQSYDPLCNYWTSLPYEEKADVKQIFVRNDEEMYALMSQPIPEGQNSTQTPNLDLFSVSDDELDYSLLSLESYIAAQRKSRRRRRRGRNVNVDTVDTSEARQYASFIKQYKPESNFWETIASFDLGVKERFCIVAKDSFIYFLGGAVRGEYKYLTDVSRYNLWTGMWAYVASMQEGRMQASGAAGNGKIYIAGGNTLKGGAPESCEVYNEATDEWQFIASLTLKPTVFSRMVNVDGKLYVLGGSYDISSPHADEKGTTVQCYDPQKNEWNEKTKIPFDQNPSNGFGCASVCSMRLFKGFLSDLQKASFEAKVSGNSSQDSRFSEF